MSCRNEGLPLPFAEKSTLVVWYVLRVEVWHCQGSGSFSVTNQSWHVVTIDYWWWILLIVASCDPSRRLLRVVHKEGFIPAFRIFLVFSRYFPLARLRGEVHSKHRLYSLHCRSWSAFHQTLHTWKLKHVVMCTYMVSKTMSMLQNRSKKHPWPHTPIKLLCSKPASRSRVHWTMVAIKSMGPMQWRHGDLSQDGPGTRDVGKALAAEAKIEECEGICRLSIEITFIYFLKD